MKEYDAYLFDADGTLIDTRELICRSFMAMEKEMGVPPLSREAVQDTIGLPFDRQLRVLVGKGYDNVFYERATAVYRTHMMETYRDFLMPFPGAAETLERLRRLGKKMAVVSSRRLNSLALFLEATGLHGFFDLLVTPESTREHKPHPEPALFALRSLGSVPDRSVFVGDAIFDIECGKAAGMDAVLVRWGGMNHEDWPVQPNAVVRDFFELLPD